MTFASLWQVSPAAARDIGLREIGTVVVVALVLLPGLLATAARPWAFDLNFPHIVLFSAYYVWSTLPVSAVLLWRATRTGWIGPLSLVTGGGVAAAVIGLGVLWLTLGPASPESLLKAGLLIFPFGSFYGFATWVALQALMFWQSRRGRSPQK